MNNNSAKCLVQAMACMARIEGMKVANQLRLEQGFALAYDDDSFFTEANQLENLAVEIANWSHTE